MSNKVVWWTVNDGYVLAPEPVLDEDATYPHKEWGDDVDAEIYVCELPGGARMVCRTAGSESVSTVFVTSWEWPLFEAIELPKLIAWAYEIHHHIVAAEQWPYLVKSIATGVREEHGVGALSADGSKNRNDMERELRDREYRLAQQRKNQSQ